MKNLLFHPEFKEKIFILRGNIRKTALRLEYLERKAREREERLFEKTIEYSVHREEDLALIYADEVYKLREMIETLSALRIALERLFLRLETVETAGDLLNVLRPANMLLRELRGLTESKAPGISLELIRLEELAEELESMIGTMKTPLSYNFDIHVEREVKRILDEARSLATARASMELPLPLHLNKGEAVSDVMV